MISFGKKVTISDLPDLQKGLTSCSTNDTKYYSGESESTHTDFEEFVREVELRLLRIRYEGQKNRLYRTTLWVGNVEDSERPSLESALFMMNELDLLSSTSQVIDGRASPDAETVTSST
jgi:hypothetical protein